MATEWTSDVDLDGMFEAMRDFKPLPASEVVKAITIHRMPDLPIKKVGPFNVAGLVALPTMPGEIEVRIDTELRPGVHILHYLDGHDEVVDMSEPAP